MTRWNTQNNGKEIIGDLWPGIVDRSGQGWRRLPRRCKTFNILLTKYGQAMFFASREVGGIYVSRNHKGDANATAPFVVVERRSNAMHSNCSTKLSSATSHSIPPALYNI